MKKQLIALTMISTIGVTSIVPLFSETNLVQASVSQQNKNYIAEDDNESHFKVITPKYYKYPYFNKESTYVYSDANLTSKKNKLNTEAINTAKSMGAENTFLYKTESSGNSRSLKVSILKPRTNSLKTIGYIDKNLFKNQNEINDNLKYDYNVKVKDVNNKEFINENWKQKTVSTIIKKDFPMFTTSDINNVDGTTSDFYHKTYYVENHFSGILDPSEKYSQLNGTGSHDGAFIVNDKALSNISNTKLKGDYYSVGEYKTLKKPSRVYSELGDCVNNGNKEYTIKKNVNSSDYIGKNLYIKGAYTHVNNKILSEDTFIKKPKNVRQVYYSVYDKKDGKWLGYIEESAFEDGLTVTKQYSNETYVSVAKPNYDIWLEENFKSKNGKAQEGEWFRAGYEYKHSNGSTYVQLLTVDKFGMGTIHGFINKNALKFEDNNFGPYKSFKKNVKITKEGYGIYKDKNFKKKVNTSDKLKNKTFYAKGCYDRFKSPATEQKGNYDKKGNVLINKSNITGAHGGRYYSLYDSKGNWQGYINANACTILK